MRNRYLVERKMSGGDWWEVSGKLHHSMQEARLEVQSQNLQSVTPGVYQILELKIEVMDELEIHPYKEGAF